MEIGSGRRCLRIRQSGIQHTWNSALRIRPAAPGNQLRYAAGSVSEDAQQSTYAAVFALRNSRSRSQAKITGVTMRM